MGYVGEVWDGWGMDDIYGPETKLLLGAIIYEKEWEHESLQEK